MHVCIAVGPLSFQFAIIFGSTTKRHYAKFVSEFDAGYERIFQDTVVDWQCCHFLFL